MNAPLLHTYQDIDGWFDWEDTYRRWAKDTPERGRIVEVGNFCGRSLAFLLVELLRLGRTDVSVYAIDSGAGVELPGYPSGAVLEKTLRDNLEATGYPAVTIIREPSIRAVQQFLFGTVDRVWLDGAHDEFNVFQDLEAWWPRVCVGGEMGGHDYTSHYGVNVAVNRWKSITRNEMIGLESCHVATGEPVQTTSWLFKKRSL